MQLPAAVHTLEHEHHESTDHTYLDHYYYYNIFSLFVNKYYFIVLWGVLVLRTMSRHKMRSEWKRKKERKLKENNTFIATHRAVECAIVRWCPVPACVFSFKKYDYLLDTFSRPAVGPSVCTHSVGLCSNQFSHNFYFILTFTRFIISLWLCIHRRWWWWWKEYPFIANQAAVRQFEFKITKKLIVWRAMLNRWKKKTNSIHSCLTSAFLPCSDQIQFVFD